MRNAAAMIALALAVTLPITAWSQDAQSILQQVHAREIERWAGVENYSIDQSMMGNQAQLYYERLTDDAGNALPAFRLVPPQEVERRRAEGQGFKPLTASELREFANAYDVLGQGLAQGVQDGMSQAGLPTGLLKVSGLDPRDMTGQISSVLRFAAEGAEDDVAGRSKAEALSGANDIAQLAPRFHVVRREMVERRNAFLLQADGVNRVQALEKGQEFTLQTISLWIDAQEYVLLRTKMAGVVKSGRETRPVEIEQLSTDYRAVPGSKMYQPYKQVLRLSGVMDAKQQKEMQDAQAQMAKLEKQLEQMPPAQKQMIMSRMGPQLETMKKMAAGQGIEVLVQVNAISVNAGLPQQSTVGIAGVSLGGGAFSAALSSPTPPVANGNDLVQRIQKDLVALGYDPGSIDGELTAKTAVAISKFQADSGLEVTGKASPALAATLSAKVAALRNPPQGSSDPRAAESTTAADECHHTVAGVAKDTQKKVGAFGRLASAASRIGRGSKKLAQSASEVAAASQATAGAAAAVGTLAGDSGAGCD
jgi:peptidoglycan hydrolase-like protein with peptidoglycan-binding domain